MYQVFKEHAIPKLINGIVRKTNSHGAQKLETNLVGNCLYSFSVQVSVVAGYQHWYRVDIMLEGDVPQCTQLSGTLQSEWITFQFQQNNHPFCQYIQFLIWLWCYVFPMTHLAGHCFFSDNLFRHQQFENFSSFIVSFSFHVMFHFFFFGRKCNVSFSWGLC